jgi:hypothetical protein
MAFAVEGRYPFLDHVVVERSLAFASSALYSRGWAKEPMRLGFADRLPPEVTRRRTKFGFETPQDDWIAGPLRVPIERFQWPLALAVLCLVVEPLIGERTRAKPTAKVAPKRTGEAPQRIGAAGLVLAAALDPPQPPPPRTARRRIKTVVSTSPRRVSRRGEVRPRRPSPPVQRRCRRVQGRRLRAASEAFAHALAAEGDPVKEQSFYNLGNAQYRLGEATRATNPQSAAQAWRQAIASYEEALRIEDADADARFNRDFVKKKLEELEKQPPQPSPSAQPSPQPSPQGSPQSSPGSSPQPNQSPGGSRRRGLRPALSFPGRSHTVRRSIAFALLQRRERPGPDDPLSRRERRGIALREARGRRRLAGGFERERAATRASARRDEPARRSGPARLARRRGVGAACDGRGGHASPRQTGARLVRTRSSGALRRAVGLSFLLAALAPQRRAATISAELHPAEISLGQDARLSVTIVGSQNAPAPRLPPIDGLEMRGIGQTMSMQIVGGQINSEVTHNFLIQPTRAGSFTIPALTVTASGETLETKPLALRVLPAAFRPRRPAAGAGAARLRGRPAPSCAGLEDQVDQSVGRVAPSFVVSAVSPDGVIEAIERPASTFCLGVQWHPENFWRTGEFASLFEQFVDAARRMSRPAAR